MTVVLNTLLILIEFMLQLKLMQKKMEMVIIAYSLI